MKFTSERNDREIMSKRVEESLCDAATNGDVELLKEIMAKDDCILNKVAMGCFGGKNPLHLAIAARKAEFVEELLNENPKLAEVIDAELGAALHIAAGNWNRDLRNEDVDLKIVEALVKASPGMCKARDRDGYNPLHIATMKGKVKVLEKLMQTCSIAALVTLDQGETILHLCAKYNQPGSLLKLLKLITSQDFINMKDAGGNTILHIAVSLKHIQIIEHVLNHTEVDVNAVNANLDSAMDICLSGKNCTHETEKDVWNWIENFLLAAGAKTYNTMGSPLDQPERDKNRLETLVIVATLFATMSFQVGVNPPGGVWQDNSDQHIAGKAVLAYKYPTSYSCFMVFNTIGFLLSLTLIQFSSFVLTLPATVPETRMFWVIPGISLSAIMCVTFSYLYSLISVSPKHKTAGATYTILVSVIVWAFLVSSISGLMMIFVETDRLKKDWKTMSRLATEMPRPLRIAVGENVEVSVDHNST